jgi:antitoxin component of MazEF toxin-antitoxin module
MQAAFPIGVQAIRAKGQKLRFYVAIPNALAAAMGIEPGEEVEWEVLTRSELHLVRPAAKPPRARRAPRKDE